MENSRKGDGDVGQERSRSGVYKAVAPQVLSKLRQERTAAAARVSLIRSQLIERRNASGDELSWRALQEIDAAHEQLRSAEEEVRALADEVLATRADLDAERRIYRELFDAAPEAFVVTSDKGTIVQANQAAGQLFNVDAAFLLGKPLSVFVPRDDHASFFDLLSMMATNVVRTELRVQARNAERPLVVGVSARRGFSANPGCIGWMMRSLRDEKEQDARRSQLEGQLRHRVHELETSERSLGHLLEREQSISKEAEERSRRKGEALTAVAHEIRGPLGTIAGWLHMLDRDGLGSQVRKRAALSMTRSVRALARLVDDLIEHARVENHQIVLNITSVNLVRLVCEVAEDIRPLAELKKLHLELSAAPHNVAVHGDPWRLQQVFRNLLSNAVKFTPEGGTVRIVTRLIGAHAEVAISDTGCGISRDALARVFMPFVQIGEPRAGHDGLGLGLSIAHRLVELHDGKLEAHSDGPGLGSTFTVRLPTFSDG